MSDKPDGAKVKIYSLLRNYRFMSDKPDGAKVNDSNEMAKDFRKFASL